MVSMLQALKGRRQPTNTQSMPIEYMRACLKVIPQEVCGMFK